MSVVATYVVFHSVFRRHAFLVAPTCRARDAAKKSIRVMNPCYTYAYMNHFFKKAVFSDTTQGGDLLFFNKNRIRKMGLDTFL